jgi:cytochrome c-type biogenesis protein CcmH
VRELMAQGRSDDQIKAYLRARYGDFILMQPPLEPATWLLWLGPFLVLAGAGGVAWRVISRAQKAQESQDSSGNSSNIANL